MLRLSLVPALLTAVVAVCGCGGGSSGEPARQPAKKGPTSSLACLKLSILTPKPFGRGSGGEPDLRPLFTRRARAVAFLTGSARGADVIEYPDAEAARNALKHARSSPALRRFVKPGSVEQLDRTLFLDYTHEPLIEKIVTACAKHPEQKPPAT